MVLRPSGLWLRGRRFPCVIGRGGVVADKKEGDGGTPVGVHRILAVLYRPDRMAPPAIGAVPIRPYHLWCDDPDHPEYNKMTRMPFDGSAERLARADPLYDLVLVTDWNWPEAKAGRGSAIFLHRWRRPGCPTEGCVALHPKHLLWLARNLTDQTRLIVPPQP